MCRARPAAAITAPVARSPISAVSATRAPGGRAISSGCAWRWRCDTTTSQLSSSHTRVQKWVGCSMSHMMEKTATVDATTWSAWGGSGGEWLARHWRWQQR